MNRSRSAEWLSLGAAIIGVVATIAASTGDDTRTATLWVTLAGGVVGSVAAAALSLTALRRRERRSSSNRVFIIHSHEDVDQARLVADWLREEGFDPWLDTERISAGQLWKEEVAKALENSGAAVLLVTPNLDTSKGSTSEELRRARADLRSMDENLSPVIPVLFGDADLPLGMRDVHAAAFLEDLGKASISDGLRRVLSGR